MQSRDGKSHRERRVEERRSEKRKSHKKEDAGARKGRTVAKLCVFSNGLWLRRAEPAGQMRDEKLHAVVARSTFRSQSAHTHTMLGPLLEFRCRFAWQVKGLCTFSKVSKP